MKKNEPGDRTVVGTVLLCAFLVLAVAGCSGKNRSAQVSKENEQKVQAALALQGDEAFRNNQYDAALALFDQAMEAGYAKDQGEIRKGRVFMAMGQWGQAKERFKEALQESPENIEAMLLAGHSAFQAKDMAMAEAMLKSLATAQPENVLARDLLGVVYNKLGKPELAVVEFQAVEALGKASPGTYNNHGLALYMLGRYEKALESFRKALAAGPFPRAQNNLALTYCRLKKYDEAFRAFKDARGEIAANNNVGCCLVDDGQPQKAQEYFNKAIALSPRIYKPAKDNLARMEADIQQASSDSRDGDPVQTPAQGPAQEPVHSPAAAPAPATAPKTAMVPAAAPVPAKTAMAPAPAPTLVNSRVIRPTQP